MRFFYILKIMLFFITNYLFLMSSYASENLSYSGRLVHANGQAVSGPVTIKAELSYTNTPGTILCTQTISDVPLTKGVFHLKLNLNCSAIGSTLPQVLAQIPAGESVAIRITDMTNAKAYGLQAIHSIPFASVASQLNQMGATHDQVLKWNNTNKKWEPGNLPSGGSVTSVSGTLPLSVSNGTTTPNISIMQASNTTSGYLSSADWNAFNSKQGALPTGGNATHYYRGDNSWQILNTDNVTEGTKLYFENARVLLAPLIGFLPNNSAILETDTILQAFNKTQGQINNLSNESTHYLLKDSNDTLSGNINLTGVITSDPVLGDVIVRGTPLGMTSAVSKSYVDGVADLKVNKTGDTMSGALTLDSDLKIKGNGASTNYVTIKGNSSTANYTLVLPTSAGNVGEVLQTNGSGELSWVSPNSLAMEAVAVQNIPSGSVSSNTIQDAINELATEKEPAVSAGTASQYYKGNKTWGTFVTDVLNSALGTITPILSRISAGDSIQIAFNKTQGQLDSIASNYVAKDGTNVLTGTTTVQGVTSRLIVPTPLITDVSDATNVQFVKDYVDLNGKWEKSGVNIFYNAGNVGVGTASPTEKLSVAGVVESTTGGFKFPDGTTQTSAVSGLRKVRAITSDFTLTNNEEVLICNSSSGNKIITLPSAVGNEGREYFIKKVDASSNTVTINTISSQKIDNNSSMVLSAQFHFIHIISDGSNWILFGSQSMASINLTITTNTTNYNIKTAAMGTGWSGTTPVVVNLTINSGVNVYSTSISNAGLTVGSFPTGSIINITNNGNILGWGPATGASDKTTNQAWEGGVAMLIDYQVTLNNLGLIVGGSGGGGASEGDSCGGCGGGNGGSAGGAGGPAISFSANATITNSGGIYGGGGGGAGGGGAFSAGVGSGYGGDGQGAYNGSIQNAIAGQTTGICGGGFGGNGGSYGLVGGNSGSCGNGAASGGAGGYSMLLSGRSVSLNGSTVVSNSSYTPGTWISGTLGRIAP